MQIQDLCPYETSPVRSVTRRDFMRGGAIAAISTLTLPEAAAQSSSISSKASSSARAGRAVPLAQHYCVVARVPDRSQFFFNNPGFALLPGGTFVASAAQDPRKGTLEGGLRGNSEVVVSRSDDRGVNWRICARLPMDALVGAGLFVHERKLYLLIAPKYLERGTIRVAVSEDGGENWTRPVNVVESSQGWYGAHQHGMVVRDGKLYWAVSEMFQRMAIVSCDLRQGLLRREAWRVSNMAEMPIPKEVDAGMFSGPSMRCLEGNVILIKDRLRVMARAVIDRNGTANMGAVFNAEDDGNRLTLTFAQLYPVPGGQCKYFILHDAVSGLYWMASNLVSNSQAWAKADGHASRVRDDRRFLMLWYACDALNWFPAGCIAAAESLQQSFHYPSLIIDGNDLLVLARTSVESGSYHDSDLLTFHRIEDFRSLALNIWPRG